MLQSGVFQSFPRFAAIAGDNVSCKYCGKTYKKTNATSSTNPLSYH